MISVIMPVYNAELFLKEAIDSILNQTEQSLELIIINDGSTDRSEDIIQSYNDTRINYFEQSNQGIAAARNKGIELAQGEFIAFQDADDISLPLRLEVLKKQFTSPDIGLVHSDVVVINEKEDAIGYWHAYNIKKTNVLRFFVKIGAPVIGASIMIRREVLQGFKYDTSLVIGEDNNMLCEIMQKWDSNCLSEPLYLYRRHTSNTTIRKISNRHLIKLIESYDIKKIIPEINWANEENEARARAILAIFLFKRGAIEEAKQLLQSSLIISKGKDSQVFVQAMANLLLKKYERALELFCACSERDHIIENYIGETLAFLDEVNAAKKHFIRALFLKPNYIEPLDNLKGVAGREGVNLLDQSWRKFM
ncbi:glycosyltransferase [Bacillus mobilis]